MKNKYFRFSALVRLMIMALFLFTAFPRDSLALGGALSVSFRDAANVSLGSYTHLKFPSWGDRTHFGNDVLASCGSVIYAPGSGVVVDVVRPGTENHNSLGNAVMIRHQGGGRGGVDLFSLILHMQDSPPVSVGDEVTADTVVGRVGMTGAANNICHAHFELRYFQRRFHTSYNNIYANGNVSGTSTAQDNWENPNSYALTLIPYSYFDGAGSLIDPARGSGCSLNAHWGCSRDVVRLHAHSVPSTGVFQVYSQPGHCDYVSIEGLQASYIGVKRWHETYPSFSDGLSTIYKASGSRVHVRIPSNQWVLLSVTTTVPIPAGSYRNVVVSCQAGAYVPASGSTLTDIAPPLGSRSLNPYPLLVKLPADFHWSGSGSLITRSGNTSSAETAAGYGRMRDEAIKLSSKKSLLSFQVYSDGSSCQSVRISDATGVTGADVETSVKGWADPDWSQTTTGPLPRNVNLPGSGFWIVKVKPAAIGWAKVRLVCN
jgi:Peptidase family M23